jgi:hypothetical protein
VPLGLDGDGGLEERLHVLEVVEDEPDGYPGALGDLFSGRPDDIVLQHGDHCFRDRLPGSDPARDPPVGWNRSSIGRQTRHLLFTLNYLHTECK